MTRYFQVRLGRGAKHVETCVEGGFIGVDYGIHEDLTGQLPDDWRAFNERFRPVYLAQHPDKSKVAAGLACGAIWTVSKGIEPYDVVVCPDSNGKYHVGEVTGHYSYVPNGILPHRRTVRWFTRTIEREEMSETLQNSTRSIATVAELSKYADEIAKLIEGDTSPTIHIDDETVLDPVAFAMEQHLEEFLVQNWSQCELAPDYDIFEEDGELIGRQYQTDTGPMDILAISKDRKTLLVVELKKGRASDVVVGQILRYMGYVQEELAEEGQQVRGAIIALEDSQRLRRAVSLVPVDVYRYEISFRLVKVSS